MINAVATIGISIMCGIAGMAIGRICRSSAPYICELMRGYEGQSAYLAKLRGRTLKGTEFLRRFRMRSTLLGDCNKDIRKKIERANKQKGDLEREIFMLGNRQDPSWRMVGDERKGGRCFAAEISNSSIAKQDLKFSSSQWATKDWRVPVIALLWADGRGDARNQLEAVYPHSDGFTIGRVVEYDGSAELVS